MVGGQSQRTSQAASTLSSASIATTGNSTRSGEMCGNQSENESHACVRHMIRTLNGDLFPGFHPLVRVSVTGGDENERGRAAVTEGTGH